MKPINKVLPVTILLLVLVASMNIISPAKPITDSTYVNMKERNTARMSSNIRPSINVRKTEEPRPCRAFLLNRHQNRHAISSGKLPTIQEPVLIAGIKEFFACYTACRGLGLTEGDCVELCSPFLDLPPPA